MQLLMTVVSFLVLDGVWIYFVANPLYKRALPKEFLADPIRIIYAILFYLLFSFSLWFIFIRKAHSVSQTLLIDVFLFGLTAYATYALTNLALISEWNLKVTVPDLIWGGVVSVLVTVITLSLLP